MHVWYFINIAMFVAAAIVVTVCRCAVSVATAYMAFVAIEQWNIKINWGYVSLV